MDEDLDETERAYYESSFSFALQEALERTGGDPSLYPFDDGYDEYQYSLSDELFDSVFELVEEAADKRGQSQRFQLATFIFAIGLAFSSWASLADDNTRMHSMFALFSIATAVVGAVAYALALQSVV